MPDSIESLDRKGKGPFNKNLVIPKELEKRLRIKVSNGRVLCCWVAVTEFWVKNPCVAKMIARDI